jgi:predicted phosphodiesterase
MIVGIWGDTHNNVEKIEEAVRLFEKYGVGLVLNTGDHERQDLYDELGFNMIAVLGNHDVSYRFENYKMRKDSILSSTKAHTNFPLTAKILPSIMETCRTK